MFTVSTGRVEGMEKSGMAMAHQAAGSMWVSMGRFEF